MHFLKKTLEKLYIEYNFNERLKHDPIRFPHRYTDPDDIEIAGFIASSFAYGKVELFSPVIEKILKPGGKHPVHFFLNFNPKKDSKHLKDISYRFNKVADVLCFVYMISIALQKWGSLKNLFYHNYRPEYEDTGQSLKNFIDFFLGLDTSAIYGKNLRPYGLNQLFPTPEKGSACKRMNLFLRWMVRNKDIDFGLWGRIPLSKLIIPLDTHIAKISKCLGMTRRTSSDWKTAKEITESLKKLDPEDPLKYDFALCHHGISGLCKGMNRIVHTKRKKFTNTCSTCQIYTSSL